VLCVVVCVQILGSVCGACVGLSEDRGGVVQPWVALITGTTITLSLSGHAQGLASVWGTLYICKSSSHGAFSYDRLSIHEHVLHEHLKGVMRGRRIVYMCEGAMNMCSFCLHLDSSISVQCIRHF
jgi:hypothetical protein